MTPAELQKILQGDDKLTIKQIKEIIYELKNDCFDEIIKLHKKQKEIEIINIAEWGIENTKNALTPYYEEKFYYGESNAFYICLDLLEKVGENEE